MKILLALLLGLGVAMPAAAAEAVGIEPTMTHRMMMLAIQLGAILFAAKLCNMLFERLRMPGPLGELVAGILIGPYLLGGFSLPGFPHGVFPVGAAFPVSPELYGICAVASIVLLFMVGLETDITLFMRYSLAGSLVGLSGVLFSFILGDLTAVVLSPLIMGVRCGPMSPPCLFLGIISTATSVGITARVLSERRKLDSPEGVTILAGAVIDDVLGIILLAVGLGVIAASRQSGHIDWAHIGVIAAKAVGIWLAATVVGLAASRRISLLLKWFRDRSSIAIMALGLALILAGLFEEAGLAMIIGAYVMGLSLSRTDINMVIREKIDPIYAFLVPVFFAVMGMFVDLRVLASGPVLVFGLLYTGVAVLAKVVGCGLPALCCNFNMRGALRIGFGMLPRGEVALIIAGIGMAAGFLSSEVFGVSVLMTLVTTLVAPPVLMRLYRGDREGLRKSVASIEEQVIRFDFPTPQTVELLTGKLLAVFEAEGFFAHALSRPGHIYQLRKDSTVISFRRDGATLVFDCGRDDIPFINTAMYEVLAELESTMRELRKPVDRETIVRRMQDESPGPASASVLSRYLRRDALIPELKGTTKRDVIDELLQVLRRTGSVADTDAAQRAVWTREESMSTGMQHGIAIPHGRTDGVKELVCAVGIKHEGVDFDAIDGEPSQILVLTLSPLKTASPHVQFMSAVSQALNEEGREALLACHSRGDMYRVLSGKTSPHRFLQEQRPADATRQACATSLSQYLRPEAIAVDLRAPTPTGIIDELLALLEHCGAIQDTAAARAAVLERHAQIPTGLEHGVAIPHARTDAVGHLVCAVGIKRGGADFGAADGKPSRIIVLTLSPKNAPAPHVQLMAMLSRALDAQGRERVLSAQTSEEIRAALLGSDPGKA